jgi:hypothetical protein
MPYHKVQKSFAGHNAISKKSTPLSKIPPWTNADQHRNTQAAQKPLNTVKPPTTEEWMKDNVLLRAIETRQAELQQQEIQAKLTVGEPGDKYEQEADMMANRVMSMPDSNEQWEVMPDRLQTKPFADGDAITPLVQRQETSDYIPYEFTPPEVDNDASSLEQAELNDLFRLYTTRLQVYSILQIGHSYSRNWIYSPEGTQAIRQVIQNRLQSYLDQAEADDTLIAEIRALDGLESRKRQLQRIVEQTFTPASGRLFNGRGRPRAGMILAGQTFYNTGDHLVIRGPFTGREYLYAVYRGYRGLQYMGQSNWPDVVERTVQEMIDNGELQRDSYRHRVAQGMPILHEGGLSAINTYDRVIFTLGLGFAGGRLQSLLSNLRGTPVAQEVASLPHFSGLRFDGSESIRFDLETIDQLVGLIEDSQYERYFARAQVLEFINASGFGRTTPSESESQGDAVADQLDPGVVGVATYLSHGAPGFTPNPIQDLRSALRIGGSNLSKQVAVLLKLHAQRIANQRTQDRNLYNRYSGVSLEARLPHKVEYFIDFKRRTEPRFVFNWGAAREIIECIRSGRGMDMWDSSRTISSGRVYLERQGLYYDFGVNI